MSHSNCSILTLVASTKRPNDDGATYPNKRAKLNHALLERLNVFVPPGASTPPPSHSVAPTGASPSTTLTDAPSGDIFNWGASVDATFEKAAVACMQIDEGNDQLTDVLCKVLQEWVCKSAYSIPHFLNLMGDYVSGVRKVVQSMNGNPRNCQRHLVNRLHRIMKKLIIAQIDSGMKLTECNPLLYGLIHCGKTVCDAPDLYGCLRDIGNTKTVDMVECNRVGRSVLFSYIDERRGNRQTKTPFSWNESAFPTTTRDPSGSVSSKIGDSLTDDAADGNPVSPGATSAASPPANSEPINGETTSEPNNGGTNRDEPNSGETNGDTSNSSGSTSPSTDGAVAVPTDGDAAATDETATTRPAGDTETNGDASNSGSTAAGPSTDGSTLIDGEAPAPVPSGTTEHDDNENLPPGRVGEAPHVLSGTPGDTETNGDASNNSGSTAAGPSADGSPPIDGEAPAPVPSGITENDDGENLPTGRFRKKRLGMGRPSDSKLSVRQREANWNGHLPLSLINLGVDGAMQYEVPDHLKVPLIILQPDEVDGHEAVKFLREKPQITSQNADTGNKDEKKIYYLFPCDEKVSDCVPESLRTLYFEHIKPLVDHVCNELGDGWQVYRKSESLLCDYRTKNNQGVHVDGWNRSAIAMNIVVMAEEGAAPKLNVVKGSHNLVNHILGTESKRHFGDLLQEDYEMIENAAHSFLPIQVEYPTGSPILSLENVFHGGVSTDGKVVIKYHCMFHREELYEPNAGEVPRHTSVELRTRLENVWRVRIY